MTDLMTCPFCGGEARPFSFSWHASQFGGHMFEKPYWQVICEECKAAIGDFDTKAEAIAAWNSRAERTCEIKHVKGGAMYDVWRCSACGYEFVESVSEASIVQNYCPNCGAKVIG